MTLFPYSLPLVIVVALGFAACGSEDSSSSSTTKPAAPPKPYRARVASCFEDYGWATSERGSNTMRVEVTSGGTLIANVQTFPTLAEAKAFAAQLDVPHGYGGQGVAVYLGDAVSGDRSSQLVYQEKVTDCLTP